MFSSGNLSCLAFSAGIISYQCVCTMPKSSDTDAVCCGAFAQCAASELLECTLVTYSLRFHNRQSEPRRHATDVKPDSNA